MVPVNDMDSRQSYRNPKCKASRIPVVIVESHQHALEHVHEVLRKAKLLSVPWSMFHFDAHPDLACPANVPAAACFTPRNTVFPEEGEGEDDDASNNSDDSHNDPTNHQKNLYELLDDTTSGIAEWILPLVLAGNLRYVEWVKPCFSNQMDVGDYHYSVGVKDEPQSGSHSTKLVKCFLDLSKMARIKVDLLHPYYLDDHSFVPSEELSLKQDFHLQVSEAPLSGNSAIKDGPWMLDICLDYFACHNPYLADIERVSPAAAMALIGVMRATKMNAKVEKEWNYHEASQYQTDVANFSKLLKEILILGVVSRRQSEQLEKYFDDPVHIRKSIEALLKTIKEDTLLQSWVLEAIPNWSMPHAPESLSLQHLQESLRLVQQSIMQRATEFNVAPFLVTVARSTDDGFTPKDVVEFLQTELLAILHRTFCKECRECANHVGEVADEQRSKTRKDRVCQIQIIRDYGIWEESTIFDQ